MYLLYVDESGNIGDTNCFVFAGLAIHESSAKWINQKLEGIAKRFSESAPRDFELHAHEVFWGKSVWRDINLEKRKQALRDALQILQDMDERNRLFAIVVDKRDAHSKNEIIDLAFTQLITRFDHFVNRRNLAGHRNVGILVFDKSAYENKIQKLSLHFRDNGHSWGNLKYIVEVPLFVDSRASRLIQLADILAYAVFRKFERNDNSLFSIIENRFDMDHPQGKQHGLYYCKAEYGKNSQLVLNKIPQFKIA